MRSLVKVKTIIIIVLAALFLVCLFQNVQSHFHSFGYDNRFCYWLSCREVKKTNAISLIFMFKEKFKICTKFFLPL